MRVLPADALVAVCSAVCATVAEGVETPAGAIVLAGASLVECVTVAEDASLAECAELAKFAVEISADA